MEGVLITTVKLDNKYSMIMKDMVELFSRGDLESIAYFSSSITHNGR